MKKKAKVAKRAVRPPAPEREANERMPFCRICNHRHSGVAHIWK